MQTIAIDDPGICLSCSFAEWIKIPLEMETPWDRKKKLCGVGSVLETKTATFCTLDKVTIG